MNPIQSHELERFQHRQGEAVLSRDLNDQLTDTLDRSWWHNRASHDTYGIARGFEAEPHPEDKPTTVVVQAGEAYDLAGRELVLGEARTVVVPQRPGHWVLVARRAAVAVDDCGHVDARRVSPSPVPEFVWRLCSQCTPRHGVPLIAVVVKKNGASQVGCLQPPRSARLGQPKIARGSTVPGQTPWKPVSLPRGLASSHLALLRVTVDTSEAGFLDYADVAEAADRADKQTGDPPDGGDPKEDASRRQFPRPYYAVCLGGLPEDAPVLTLELTLNETSHSFDFLLWLFESDRGKEAERIIWLAERIIWLWEPTNSLVLNRVLPLLLGQPPAETDDVAAPPNDRLLALAQRHLFTRWVGIQPACNPTNLGKKENDTD